MKKQVKDLKPGDVFYLAGPSKAVVKVVVPVRFRIELKLDGQPHELSVDGDKYVETDEKA